MSIGLLSRAESRSFQLPLSGSLEVEFYYKAGKGNFQLPLSGSQALVILLEPNPYPLSFQLPLSGSPSGGCGEGWRRTAIFQLPLSGSLQNGGAEPQRVASSFQLPLSGSRDIASFFGDAPAEPFNSLSRDHSLLLEREGPPSRSFQLPLSGSQRRNLR